MKKAISLFLALALLLGILAVPALADDFTVGTLSYLNVNEKENDALSQAVVQPPIQILFLQDVLQEGSEINIIGNPVYRYYDTMDAMLMALQAGELGAIEVPYYTARYLSSINDKLTIREEYHPEKATEASILAINAVCEGYSFLLKKDNVELRDAFDAQIDAMKEDGALQKLIDEHIVKASEGGKPVAIAFEQFEGDPIKIAVTGSLPPMDYVAADGSFAGFNTAVLAEIGRRLQKNIELVQVDSVGRALALSEGTVDVVFWTRGITESLKDDEELSEEEREARWKEIAEKMTDEEKAIMDPVQHPDEETRQKYSHRDMPEGTIVTQPYFSDFPAWIILK